jgi:hypothetical protein
MAELPLSAEEEAEAQRLLALFQEPMLQEARRLARLLASKATAQLLGKTEFELREAVHHLGSQLLQTALSERKKRATRVPVSSAPTAGRMRAAKDTGSGAS